MTGTYGVNDIGYWGNYAFLNLQIFAEEIPSGAFVTTWATIQRPPVDWVEGRTFAPHGMSYVQTEIVECRVQYWKGQNYPYWEEVDVRTYTGKLDELNMPVLISENPNGAWIKPERDVSRYYQQWSGGDDGIAACYAQRLPETDASEFNLWKGVEYQVKVGYDIYTTQFSLNNDVATEGSEDHPKHLWSAESPWMSFAWWGVVYSDAAYEPPVEGVPTGATTVFASAAVALLSGLLAF